jgi:hypothetical protein
MRSLAVRLLVAAVLAATALLAVSGSLSGPARWSPDGLFYQARVYQIRDGLSQSDALRRAFGGSLGERLRTVDPDRSGSQQWVAYNARFYERRLTVPLAASVLEPLAGDRALLDVSLAGYIVAVLAVFWLLLLLRFRLAIAAGVTLATIFLPALSLHSQYPLTDSWGLALETAGFAFGIMALERDRRWVIAWAAAILLLAFTRDTMLLLVAAAAWLALRQRSKVGWWLVGTGVAASLPVLLIFSMPLRELLAMMLNGIQPDPAASWASIAERYPAAIADLLQADGGFVRGGAWFSAAYLLGGLALLFLLTRGANASSAGMLLKAGAVAGAGYVLVVPIFSAFRLELVLVPMAAYGIGLGLEWVAVRAALPARVRPRIAASGRAST